MRPPATSPSCSGAPSVTSSLGWLRKRSRSRTNGAAWAVARPLPTLAPGQTGTAIALVIGADYLEVLVDEDVVRPVDADVVDFVIAVSDCYDPVDDATRIGGQGRFDRLIRGGAADDRPRALLVVRRDLADRLGGALLALAVGNHLAARRRSAGADRLRYHFAGRDRCAVRRPQHQDGFTSRDRAS